MNEPLVITIPGTPDKCLSPNQVRRTHWGPRGRATKQARSDAYYATLAAVSSAGCPVPEPPLVFHAVIAWEKGRRSLDPTNADGILKATVDGIADALGINDRFITLATVQQERDEAGAGYVRVAIEQEARA